MASNGYVRRCCGNCIFFENAGEYGYGCTLTGEVFNSSVLRWISYSDYYYSIDLASKYDELCEHFFSLNIIKNDIRKKYNIPEIDY